MTTQTLLRTPDAWPRVLLARTLSATAGDGSAGPGDGSAGAGAGGTTAADAGSAFDDAVRAGAFEGLKRVVRDLGATGTIATIAAAGLRGRGGGGYPAGAKWRAVAAQPSAIRYVVANGYAADPSSGTDLLLMERDPFAVVEGTVIAAFAVGAREAFIAVRADATDAIARLEAAIAEAEDAGFLGRNILASGHDVDVRVRPVQGAYMLGEETVLLKALEGRRGQPEQRPPYPSERGLFGQPTLVNNVATLAAVPWIVTNGAERFAAIGSAETHGTALVQVQGPAGSGVAEVPFGTPLRELLGLAGGEAAGHPLKALLIGGPAGGLLPAELLDTPYDFAPLRAAGAHVGSGSIVAVDDRACIVDLGRLLTRFCSDEACGKTIPCRIGTRRLAEIGERVTSGRPRPTDIQLLTDLAHDVTESALCDHERLSTLPLLSAMRYFRAELDDHILRSTCPAGVCHPIAVAAAAGA